jgi:hypothetical protein
MTKTTNPAESHGSDKFTKDGDLRLHNTMRRATRGVESRTKHTVRKWLPGAAAVGLLATVATVGVFGPKNKSDDVPTSETPPTPTTVYTAQEGDTAWDIAHREIEASNQDRDDVDILPIVDDIVERNGGANIQPGDQITVEKLPFEPDFVKKQGTLPPFTPED